MLAVLVTGVPKRFGLIHDGGILSPGRAPWGAVRRYPVRRHTSTDIRNIIPSIYQSKYYVPEARRSVDGEWMWIMDVVYGCGCGCA
jgi:hypothetical protein